MPAPTRTNVGLAAALLLSAPLLGACGAGRNSVTAHERAAIDGAQVNAGDLQLRNIHLDAPTGELWDAGSDVPLAMYVVNRGAEADQLVSVSAPDYAAGVTLTPSSITIPATGLLTTGAAHAQDSPSADGITLTGLAKALRPGQSVRLVLTFSRAGVVTVYAPVATS